MHIMTWEIVIWYNFGFLKKQRKENVLTKALAIAATLAYELKQILLSDGERNTYHLGTPLSDREEIEEVLEYLGKIGFRVAVRDSDREPSSREFAFAAPLPHWLEHMHSPSSVGDVEETILENID